MAMCNGSCHSLTYSFLLAGFLSVQSGSDSIKVAAKLCRKTMAAQGYIAWSSVQI